MNVTIVEIGAIPFQFDRQPTENQVGQEVDLYTVYQGVKFLFCHVTVHF